MSAALMFIDAEDGKRWWATGFGASTASAEAVTFDFDPRPPGLNQEAFKLANRLWGRGPKYGTVWAHVVDATTSVEVGRVEFNAAGVIRIVAPAVTS